jgi:site-specific DNA recombinase
MGIVKSTKIKFDQGIAILRVSSHRQKDNTSHETQEAEVRSYAAEAGIEIDRVFHLVESAKATEARKKYHAALNYALKQKIGAILFYMHDREARNLTDNETNERLVRAGQIEIHYVRDRKVLNRNSPEFEYIMRDFMAVNNKQFSRVLSMKVNDAMTAKAEAGWFPNNHVPLGYVHKKIENENGRESKRGTIIVPDPNHKNVKWVQREFELRAQGYTLEQICQMILNENLVPAARGKDYRASTIEKRIKNPFYRGQFRWKGEFYKGKHELIIPKHILDKIDGVPTKAYTRRFTADEGILAGGWLKCADEACGCNLVYDPKTKINKTTGQVKVFQYYHCTNGRKVHETMSGMNVTEAEIWSQLSTAIEAVTISHDQAHEFSIALNELERELKGGASDSILKLENERVDLESRMNKLVDMYLDVQIEKDLFEKQKARIKVQIQDIDRQIADLKGDSSQVLENAESTLELAKIAKDLWKERSDRERRDFLNELLSNPRLRGRTVEYDLKKPFAVLAEMATNQNWRPHGDSNPGLLRERELS